MSRQLSENVHACHQVAAFGCQTAPLEALPHPWLAEQTARQVAGCIEPAPGGPDRQRIRFGQGFADAAIASPGALRWNFAT